MVGIKAELLVLWQLLFSRQVMTDSASTTSRFPVLPPSPTVCSNSCPLSQWCCLTFSSSAAPFSFCLQSFPASRSFPMSHRWPKYWSFSFSISPSNEYSGLISFSIDWLDLLAVQGTLKNLLQHHSLKASVLQCSAFFMIQLSLGMCSVFWHHFSHVWLFATPWTVPCQAPLSMGFSRQEYQSGWPYPPPGDLPDPGIIPHISCSFCTAGRFFTSDPPGKYLTRYTHGN